MPILPFTAPALETLGTSAYRRTVDRHVPLLVLPGLRSLRALLPTPKAFPLRLRPSSTPGEPRFRRVIDWFTYLP